jgi:hypothetical protein
MIQEVVETEVLATLRDLLTSDSPLRLVESTKKLARMLAGSELASIETRFCSSDMPLRGLLSHCSRETSRAQAQEQGDSRHATPSLPR